MNNSTTTSAIEDLKAAHRATWDSGDYAAVARDLVTEVAEAAVEAAAPGPGDDLLDVATGSGNAAIPAARRGARVTGLDLAPSLLEAARERADSEQLEIDWIEGDAEALPFADASFNKALSVLGIQFAPRHQVCARELARVARPGGTIVLCNWTPQGFIGQFFKTISPYMPEPPRGVSPPPLWGDEQHVDDLFAELGVEFEFERREVTFEGESPAAFVDYMAENYGPLVKAKERLSPLGTWTDLHADLVALSERSSLTPDRFRTPSEFLLVKGRKV